VVTSEAPVLPTSQINKWQGGLDLLSVLGLGKVYPRFHIRSRPASEGLKFPNKISRAASLSSMKNVSVTYEGLMVRR